MGTQPRTATHNAPKLIKIGNQQVGGARPSIRACSFQMIFCDREGATKSSVSLPLPHLRLILASRWCAATVGTVRLHRIQFVLSIDKSRQNGANTEKTLKDHLAVAESTLITVTWVLSCLQPHSAAVPRTVPDRPDRWSLLPLSAITLNTPRQPSFLPIHSGRYISLH